MSRKQQSRRNHKSRQKASFRKRQENKGSMLLVTFAALVIVCVIFVSGVGLQKKIDEYDVKIQELQAEIQKEEERKDKLEEYRKYTQTKGFVEEVAQDQIGLVYPGEMIFKQEN